MALFTVIPVATFGAPVALLSRIPIFPATVTPPVGPFSHFQLVFVLCDHTIYTQTTRILFTVDPIYILTWQTVNGY